MSVADEEWIRAAVSDDSMVAELLLRFHHAPPAPVLLKRAAPPPKWSVRQRRSKPANKQAHRDGGSPTTPLSWSGATSDESSRSTPTPPVKTSDATRSKVVNINGDKTNNKKPRKKRTLAELRDEESLLLKERRDLKREMEALSLCLDRQRAANANLKRMKTELFQPSNEEEEAGDEFVLPDLNVPFDDE